MHSKCLFNWVLRFIWKVILVLINVIAQNLKIRVNTDGSLQSRPPCVAFFTSSLHAVTLSAHGYAGEPAQTSLQSSCVHLSTHVGLRCILNLAFVHWEFVSEHIVVIFVTAAWTQSWFMWYSFSCFGPVFSLEGLPVSITLPLISSVRLFSRCNTKKGI